MLFLDIIICFLLLDINNTVVINWCTDTIPAGTSNKGSTIQVTLPCATNSYARTVTCIETGGSNFARTGYATQTTNTTITCSGWNHWSSFGAITMSFITIGY